jgi:hypothetical protein
VNVVDIFD